MKISVLNLTLFSISLLSHWANGFSFQGNMIRDLEGDGLSFVLEASSWKVSNGMGNVSIEAYSFCGTTYLLGGPGIEAGAAAFSKSYLNLPPHDMIYFSVALTLAGHWIVEDALIVQVESRSFALGMFMLNPTIHFTDNKCGIDDMNDLDKLQVFGKLHHNHSLLNLNIFRTGGGTESSFGIRDVYLLLRNATEEEKLQENSICGLANIPLPLNQCKCPKGQYITLDGSCQNCNVLCRTCLGPSPSQCFECSDQAFFDGNECKLTHPNANSDELIGFSGRFSQQNNFLGN